MKPVCRAFVISALALLLASPLAISAQWSKKPYTEWSEKEATKLLNESPWGRTDTFTDMSKSFSSGPGANPTARTTPSADSSVRNVHFRIRFLSARPVREAFARLIELRQKGAIPEQVAARLKAFVVSGFNDFVVVTVDCESEAKTEFQQIQALLNNRTTADLKNSTYLQSGNNKVFLEEYQSPKSDGLGARLVFPRLVDGKPWLTEASDEIHFYSELSTTYKLDMRYKVKEMMYQGKLEY
ncbi:MAG: hypothetical protein AABN34_06340 [Acidobacteriota bacterium]